LREIAYSRGFTTNTGILMKQLAAMALAVTVHLACAGFAAAQQAYLGEIRAFGSNFCPAGWALANGRFLPISQNTALFSLFGTTYGGDGKTTFALPNLMEHGINVNPEGPLGVLGVNWCVAVQGMYPPKGPKQSPSDLR